MHAFSKLGTVHPVPAVGRERLGRENLNSFPAFVRRAMMRISQVITTSELFVMPRRGRWVSYDASTYEHPAVMSMTFMLAFALFSRDSLPRMNLTIPIATTT